MLICMDNELKVELKEIMSNLLETHSAKIDGKFDVIHVELLAIKDQTTKTNGKVLRAESDIKELQFNDKNHGNLCPQTKRIEDLEKDDVSNAAIKKFLITILASCVALAAILTFIYEVFIK